MNIEDFYDCVVMFTMSDWRTEPISNRYHYATRFSNHFPTIFIQFDNNKDCFDVDYTEFERLYVVHAPRNMQQKLGQSDHSLDSLTELESIVTALGGRRRLLWSFNPFVNALTARFKFKKFVYHATELYALHDRKFALTMDLDQYVYLNQQLTATLEKADAVACVSGGVEDTIVNLFNYKGEIWLLPNGCDHNVWIDRSVYLPDSYRSPKLIDNTNRKSQTYSKKVLFQGGINYRLDFDLLYDMASRMPDWTFVFCGTKDLSKASPKATAFFNLPNVDYRGALPVDKIKALASTAAVGIIPFVKSPLIEKSMPLKAFEYVAAGLPVVSVPIDDLAKHGDLFSIARTADEFCEQIERVAVTRFNRDSLARRIRAARTNSWDRNFDMAKKNIINLKDHGDDVLNVLILYSDQSTHVRAINIELQALKSLSRHNIYFAPASTWSQTEPFNYMPDVNLESRLRDEFSEGINAWNFSIFDAIIVHYSVRVTFDFIFSDYIVRKLRNFTGSKALFLQDEYEQTEIARKWMDLLNFDIVYTCVPTEHIEKIYPADRYPNTRFTNVLTGYVTPDLRDREWVPLEQRDVAIGYRGRPLSHRYGKLGFEKRHIGQRVRALAEEAGLKVDIEWSEEARVYGGWLDFLGSVRATLATESGSNMFDFDGHLDAKAKAWKDLSFEEAYNRYFEKFDNYINMGQVSPKIFESIAVGTLLICFEGEYSGVIQPDVHFVPLKKDFSNIDDVFKKLMNDEFVQNMTERAYKDIILSGEYDIEKHIGRIDKDLNDCNPRGRIYDIVSTPIAVRRDGEVIPLIRSSTSSLVINNWPIEQKEARKGFLSMFKNMEIMAKETKSYSREPQLLFREHRNISKYDDMGFPIKDGLREVRIHKQLMQKNDEPISPTPYEPANDPIKAPRRRNFIQRLSRSIRKRWRWLTRRDAR